MVKTIVDSLYTDGRAAMNVHPHIIKIYIFSTKQKIFYRFLNTKLKLDCVKSMEQSEQLHYIPKALLQAYPCAPCLKYVINDLLDTVQ